MLRLAPSHPPLWRTPPSVQLGPDPDGFLDAVTPWQERLLEALTVGVPEEELDELARRAGAGPDDADAFVRRIRPALAADHAPAPPVAVELPEALTAAEERTLLGSLQAAGIVIAGVTRWPAPRGRRPVLLVAHRLVDPHRAARLVASDTPHLPIQLAGDQVTVGPLVTPGDGPCLSCLHASRRDADPDWPLVAAQLLGRAPVPTASVLLVEAAVLAARMLTERMPGRAVTVRSDRARRAWHAHRPHALCLCRSPAGSATAPDPGVRTSATTTATASARRA